MKYVIKWVDKKTEATGYSLGTFSKEQAKLIVKTLNEKDAVYVHAVVPYSKSNQ